jgi:adenosylhomocysteine nucleosidase
MDIYITEKDKKLIGLHKVKLHKGQLCCGDQFIGTSAQRDKIRKDLPQVLCVEMEGGAVGQVCYEYGVPYVVLRSISDAADDKAHVDFNTYINKISRFYTWGIINRLMKEI